MTSSTSQSIAESAPAIEEYLGDRSLVVVSNREPYTHEFDDGEVTVSRPAGGLTAALDPAMQALGGTWIAWGGGGADQAVVDADDRVEVRPKSRNTRFDACGWTMQISRGTTMASATGPVAAVSQPSLEYRLRGCVLGPLPHGQRPLRRRGRRRSRERPGVRLVPGLSLRVRAAHRPRPARRRGRPRTLLARPVATLGRVPAVSPRAGAAHCHASERPRRLPHRPRSSTDRQVCQGDARRLLRRRGRLEYRDREIELVTAPIGIDATAIAERAKTDAAARFRSEFATEHGFDDVQVAVGVDRLDYTKGIPERLDALTHLFEAYPDFRGEITLVQKGKGSRSRIDAYRDLQASVGDRVASINDRFGTDDWQPVVYTTEHLDETALAALYNNADLALVSPVRDGLNLMAKEFVAAQGEDPGTLVLSDTAGVATELGDAALTVTPRDSAGFADAIRRAIDTSPEERRRRHEQLKERVAGRGPTDWIDDCLRPLATRAATGDVRGEQVHATGD